MNRDPLDDMPRESRTELVEAVRALLDADADEDVDIAVVEHLIRSTEPFWDAMERAGGLVDTWGGGEFCYVLPRVLAYIQRGTPAFAAPGK